MKINDFDGILFRGDRNPNTSGLKQTLEKFYHSYSFKTIIFGISRTKCRSYFSFGPEIEKAYSQFANEITRFAELANVIYFGTTKIQLQKKFSNDCADKSICREKNGTVVNYNGVSQKLKANPPVFPAMLGIEDIFLR